MNWRARIRRAELRCPVRVDAFRLAETQAAMVLATIGGDGGPLQGVQPATLAASIQRANFDAFEGTRAVVQAIKAKAGKRKPRRKGK